MKKQKKPLYIILLLQLLFNSVFSNNKPHVINLYKEQYKAENKNWCVGQDERGIMYFGNDGGLLEFDGIEWKLNQLPNSQIARSVAVLSHQTLFTGSYEEFGRWDRDISGRLVYTSLSNDIDEKFLKNNDFWKIWITTNVVYFQSFNSIYVYDYKEVKQISLEGGLLLLSKVRDEFLVQQMQGSLYRLQDDKLIKVKGSDFLSSTDVRVILPYSSDNYLIGTTTKGFYIYDGANFQEWNPSLSALMNAKDLNCGIMTSRGTYFLGTILDGIYEVNSNGEILDHISSESTLQNNTILGLYEDNLNNVWLALDRGIACIQYVDNLSYYTDPNGNTGAVYCAVIWNNKLFIGTNQGAFYVNIESLSRFDILSNMKLVNGTQGQVWSFTIIDNKLYCCHNKGLKEIHNELHVSDIFTTRGVYEFTESHINGKDVWLLSTYVALTAIDKQTKEMYSFNDISEPIINTEVDHLENIWLEHANRGVYRCRLNNNTKFYSHFSYYGGNSKDDLSYKMKIFKVGGRVVLLGDDKFYTYDDIANLIIPDNLLNECFKNVKDIKRIIPIQKDTFWVLTKTSVYKFMYDGYQASITERFNLGRNHSLVHTYENISVLNDSISLICLDNGFIIYNKEKDHKEDIQKRFTIPYLEALQTVNSIGDLHYNDVSQNTEISYDYNTITFSFSAINAFISDLSFQYKLSNVDNDWSVAQKINKVTYPRLMVGDYTFMIRTIDNMGNCSDVVSYQFKILQPWYQTVWAYMVYVLFFIIILYLAWILMLRRYRNLHLQKIRSRETKRLRALTNELQNEVEQKNAELLTQTSFIIQKNELILKIKSIVEDFYNKNKSQAIAPVYQKINALLNNNLDTEDDWKTFLFSFEQKHAGFFKKMKTLYPELTSSDLRLCACLKLNLDTKDIASLMNLSTRAVENNRYRLRKKLALSPTQKLSEFFLNIE